MFHLTAHEVEARFLGRWLLLLAVSAIGLLGGAAEAYAITWTESTATGTYSITVNSDKLEYIPGASVKLTASLTETTCSNVGGFEDYFLDAHIDGNSEAVFTGSSQADATLYSIVYVAAPAATGTHQIRLESCVLDGTGTSCTDFYLSIDVVTPTGADLVAVNTSPVEGSGFTTDDSIAFRGRAINDSDVSIVEGGQAKLFIDFDRDGTSDLFPFPGGGDPTGSFAAWESKSLVYTVLPGSLPVGDHRYRFQVDISDILLEVDDTNNISPWVNFTVTAPPPPPPPPPAPAASLTVNSCFIPAGDNSCTGEVTWTITNGTAPYLVLNTTTGVPASTDVSGVDAPSVLTYGSNVFEVSDNSGVLNAAAVSAQCVAGTSWNSSITSCEPSPLPVVVPVTATADPYFIRSEARADISVTLETTYEMDCTIENAQSAPIVFNHPGSAAPEVYTYTTRPLTSAQIVSISCVGTTDPLVTAETEVRVNVIGRVQEL